MPDYGGGKTNINMKTGIRYGVLSPHEILEFWAEHATAIYPRPKDVEIKCTECRHTIEVEVTAWGDRAECEHCHEEFDVEIPECLEPIRYEFNCDGYKAGQTPDRDVFFINSPYYTYGPFCS